MADRVYVVPRFPRRDHIGHAFAAQKQIPGGMTMKPASNVRSGGRLGGRSWDIKKRGSGPDPSDRPDRAGVRYPVVDQTARQPHAFVGLHDRPGAFRRSQEDVPVSNIKHSAKNPDWGSPPWLVGAARKVMGGIALDPLRPRAKQDRGRRGVLYQRRRRAVQRLVGAQRVPEPARRADRQT